MSKGRKPIDAPESLRRCATRREEEKKTYALSLRWEVAFGDEEKELEETYERLDIAASKTPSSSSCRSFGLRGFDFTGLTGGRETRTARSSH